MIALLQHFSAFVTSDVTVPKLLQALGQSGHSLKHKKNPQLQSKLKVMMTTKPSHVQQQDGSYLPYHMRLNILQVKSKHTTDVCNLPNVPFSDSAGKFTFPDKINKTMHTVQPSGNDVLLQLCFQHPSASLPSYSASWRFEVASPVLICVTMTYLLYRLCCQHVQ